MLRITLVQQGAVGDTVLLVPLISSLRAHFSSQGPVHITLVTRPQLGQMLNMLGHADNYFSADDQSHTAFFAENAKPTDWLACDFLLSFVSDGKDAWAQNIRRLAPATQTFFIDPRPPASFPRHVTAWHREQLAAQGLSLPEAPLPLLRSNPDGAIVIHPGSGGEAKCWPRDKFLQLGHDLKRNGAIPTFILGEAEMERWGTKFVQSLHTDFAWYLHMGFYELAERLGRARLFLGNDSGVSHLAAMVGVPVITLFGPSNDRQWHPVGPSVKILRTPEPAPNDLAALEVETVLAEMMAELRKV